MVKLALHHLVGRLAAGLEGVGVLGTAELRSVPEGGREAGMEEERRQASIVWKWAIINYTAAPMSHRTSLYTYIGHGYR